MDLVPLLPYLIALVAAGLFAGVLAGLFGIGGGAIMVPILYHWWIHLGIAPDQAMHSAVGTSLATIIATSAASARAHQKRGSVDQAIVKSWGAYVALGATLGVLIAAALNGNAMRGIFGIFLFSMGIYMLSIREASAVYHALPTGWLRRAIAGGIGMISSLVGIGGGAVSVPIMTLFGVPMQRAVGTSAAFGAVIAVPGTIGFILTGWRVPHLPPLSLGYVNLLTVAIFLPTTVLMAPLGAKLAHKLNRTMLRRIFSIYLMLISLKMLWGLFGS